MTQDTKTQEADFSPAADYYARGMRDHGCSHGIIFTDGPFAGEGGWCGSKELIALVNGDIMCDYHQENPESETRKPKSVFVLDEVTGKNRKIN